MKKFIVKCCAGGIEIDMEGELVIYSRSPKDAIKQASHTIKEHLKENTNIEYDVFEHTHWVCVGNEANGKDTIERILSR